MVFSTCLYPDLCSTLSHCTINATQQKNGRQCKMINVLDGPWGIKQKPFNYDFLNYLSWDITSLIKCFL